MLRGRSRVVDSREQGRFDLARERFGLAVSLAANDSERERLLTIPELRRGVHDERLGRALYSGVVCQLKAEVPSCLLR